MYLKQSTLLITLITLLGSCKEGTNSDLQSENSTIDKEEFISVASFHGTWVTKNYVDYLLKTKSPYLAQKSQPYKLIFIDSNLRSNRYLKITEYQYGQTERSAVQHYRITNSSLIYSHSIWENDGIWDSCTSSCPRFTLNIKGNDTLLVLHKKMKKQFIRLTTNCSNLKVDCDVQRLICSKLISGSYILLDSSKNLISNNIIIDEEGAVQGSRLIDKVVLWNYFREANHAYSFDVLEFISNENPNAFPGSINNNDSLLFQYLSIQDTIFLKSTKFDEEEYEVSVGGTKYFLIRK